AGQLLGDLQWRVADRLTELVRLEEFRSGMEWIAGPPHQTEIDSILHLMNQAARSIRFQDEANIAGWLAPYVREVPYRMDVLCHAALPLLHEGRYLEAGNTM